MFCATGRSMFTDDQKQILLKYYDNGMTSTNRHHVDVIEKCARECQTTVDKIKVEMHVHYHRDATLEIMQGY